ncbi:MAG: DUF4261 domain-containing protein [Gallionellaceae bacterium]|jgi:hypothetical protein|nr:DUF4261 domain-containing protein [Gallionellaceae bacterium]
MPEEAEYNPQEQRALSMMALLFEKKVELPPSKAFYEKLKQRGYETNAEWESSDAEMRLFYLPQYTVDFTDAKGVPYQLMLTSCSQVEKPRGDALVRSQFWQTPNGAELLDASPWQIFISDFMSSTHPAKVRAQIVSDWLEIALELFPDCKAVWFEGSQNVMTAESLRDNPYQGINRIFHGAVNARFFRVDGTEDMVVDTLGLHVFGVPDVQLHFHDLDPNHVVRLATNIGIYQLENDAPIKDGETIDGMDADGDYQPNTRWHCQHEVSLIAPKREVLDINAGEFAAGKRNSQIQTG